MSPLSPLSVLLLLSTSKIYGLGGNDIIQGRPGNCKVFTGFGNNVLMSSAASTAQLYGGSGGYFRAELPIVDIAKDKI